MSYPVPRINAGDYRTDITERLAAHLTERGYILCDNTGIELAPDRRHVNMVGILLPDTYIKQRRLLGVFPRRRRRVYLANIWTNSALRDAFPDYWRIEVIGRENFDAVQRLSQELQRAFGVRMQLHVAGDELRGEAFPGDHD